MSSAPPPRRRPNALDVARVVVGAIAGIRSKQARDFDWNAVSTMTWLTLIAMFGLFLWGAGALVVYLIRAQLQA